MSGSIRPQGRKNNKYHEPGWRQVEALVRKASAVMGGNEKAESGGKVNVRVPREGKKCHKWK